MLSRIKEVARAPRRGLGQVQKESDQSDSDVGRLIVPDSVIDAIRQGIWDFEPDEKVGKEFECTDALPGSSKKLTVLAARLSQGKPLWHPEDRLTYGDHLPDVEE